jgi:hypothetical protein
LLSPVREKCENASYAVGTHAAGRSPAGLEDVLLTEAELLATSADAHSPACAPPFGACLVSGLGPGAIDSVAPVYNQADHDTADQPYAFRCALPDGGAS